MQIQKAGVSGYSVNTSCWAQACVCSFEAIWLQTEMNQIYKPNLSTLILGDAWGVKEIAYVLFKWGTLKLVSVIVGERNDFIESLWKGE